VFILSIIKLLIAGMPQIRPSKSDAHFTVENKDHSTHANTTPTQAEGKKDNDNANVLSKFPG